jgi:peptidylamidoglycolate lyase
MNSSGAGGVLGQGAFHYRPVPGWGVLDRTTPVKNCSALVQDRDGHIILLTDQPANNIIVYDRTGRLVHKWGTDLPGAHGLTIIPEGQREVLFMTCTVTHCVRKTTLDGRILQEWGWPEATGKYATAADYLPSWTLHHPNGDFFVLDGYGRDYIVHYGADGSFKGMLGGAEGGIGHWGPHGGIMDTTKTGDPTLLIAMCDQQHLLRLSLTGAKLQRVELPGGNPRMLRRHGRFYFCPHIGDNWPADFGSRGYVSVLDDELRVVANIGGTPPVYAADGRLQTMQHQGEVFLHPHDVLVDAHDDSLYVAQFNAGATYPIKLERI